MLHARITNLGICFSFSAHNLIWLHPKILTSDLLKQTIIS
jgi:hypothetical protein